MENIIENNENTDNNSDLGKIIKPMQQQQPETENNLQLQQQQQPPPLQQDVQQQLQQEQGGIAKQIETPGEKTLEQQPLLPEEFEGEDDDEEDDDDDDDEEKETSQKLIIDIPDEEEEDEDEDDDVIALDDLPTENSLAPKENAENVKGIIKKPAEAEAIITLSDGEEDIPANEVASKPGKVQKRRSVGSNASSNNDEERFRLKRRKINVEGAPKMPLTGYVRYMNDRRESLRKEHPTKTAMEHTKMIGEEWHSLPSDVKASYLKAADADKQRYVKELDIFLKSRPDVLASELAKNKARKPIENNSPNPATITATATTTTAACLAINKQQQQHQQQQQQQVLKDKSQTADNATKSSKESIAKEKLTTKEMTPMPSTSQQALDNHKTTQEKNKRKRTPTPPTTTTTTNTISAIATNTNAASSSNATATTNAATSAASAATSAIVTSGAPGEIPIFTNEFLEHNKVYDMELRSLRKSKTDLEQQNSVLEKHVENMKFGVEKMITENNELEEKNRLLEIYLDKLKRKLALALASLPLPSAPNGATVDNIDKYMQDLYKMSTSNSHGPATLNKAKDIIRKLDLQIQL